MEFLYSPDTNDADAPTLFTADDVATDICAVIQAFQRGEVATVRPAGEASGAQTGFVYFPTAIVEQSGGELSSLYTADNKCSTLEEVAAAIERFEVVTIRPASAAETKRAEAVAALFQIGWQIGEKLNALLDQHDPLDARALITQTRDALESVQTPYLLIDRTSVPTDANRNFQG